MLALPRPQKLLLQRGAPAAVASRSAEAQGWPLAAGWVETLDAASQKVYYYHSVTKQTSWKRPTA